MNPTPNLCNYQATTTSMPEISSVDFAASPVTITGTDLNTLSSGYNVKFFLNGVEGTVSSLTATSADVTFSSGLPYGKDMVPSLRYESTTDNSAIYAKVDATTVKHTNDITSSTITGPASPLSCSYAGGCLLELNAPNLLTTLQDTTNVKVELCDDVCEVVVSESSLNQVKCRVPEYATSYSASTY